MSRLPKEFADRLANPFVRFLRIESAGGAMLLFFTVAALILSNSPWAGSFEHAWETQVGLQVGSIEFARSLREWINDGLMTLFFFVVALELKRELVLGELSKPRMAALSIVAALGGMIVPAAIYLALQSGQPGQHGWGTVMATDTAFVIGCLALLGSRIPQSLRVFMLSLAIVDDIGAILVVAIGYSSDIAWWPLVMAALGLLVIRAITLLGFRSFPLYFLVGVCIWFAVDASGIHATITGVMLGLMTPARRWVSDQRLYAILGQVIAHPASSEGSGVTKDRQTLQMAEIAARETLSPVERLEIALHPWVGFVIMPLFAFANAGMSLTLSELESLLTVAVFLGFVLGKPIGILFFCWLAIRLHIATRPPELSWRLLAGGSLLAGIGFTMALFIANMAFDNSLIDSAKLGIFFASVFSAVAGLALLMWIPERVKTP
ncbi:Na+/H+ antiporter NhaA [Ferrimonas gelatinilytica]|uniref:Na(+)/H(+) antiporter NhaA n=2 Tax=Ferrimonas gelatinilytica TaxID=1255257 RepID=A0ABP9SGF0_9GAMM